MKRLIVLVLISIFACGCFGDLESSKANDSIKTKDPSCADCPEVVWMHKGEEWQPSAKPPACPQPFSVKLPVDLSLVTSMLYPGQYRGVNQYKPHGGFRFDDNSDNKVEVRAPFDGHVYDGGRYLSGGQVQYTIDVINECGVWFRLGHMAELTPKFQALADLWPKPKEGDSRTTVTDKISVKQGELIGTQVGLSGNVFVDWGVYDLRKTNEASKNAAWLAKHNDTMGPYAICWFDWLTPEESNHIRSLPVANDKEGKKSDYCK